MNGAVKRRDLERLLAPIRGATRGGVSGLLVTLLVERRAPIVFALF
jgi:hypothetical protein